MIRPSALNLIIVGLMVIIFAFFWRMAAAKLAERNSPFADAMSVAL